MNEETTRELFRATARLAVSAAHTPTYRITHDGRDCRQEKRLKGLEDAANFIDRMVQDRQNERANDNKHQRAKNSNRCDLPHPNLTEDTEGIGAKITLRVRVEKVVAASTAFWVVGP